MTTAADPGDMGEIDQRIIAGAMRLAAVRRWRDLTMTAIAEAADVTLDALYLRFPSKEAILIGMSRMANAAALAEGPASSEEAPRDRLFDMVMRRFDGLQDYREGYIAVLRELRADPVALIRQLPQLETDMRWLLEAAAISLRGPLGAAKVRALSLIYVLTLRVWMDDDSPDMAKTMKALDTRLAQAEQLANTVEPYFGGRRGDAAEDDAARGQAGENEPRQGDQTA